MGRCLWALGLGSEFCNRLVLFVVAALVLAGSEHEFALLAQFILAFAMVRSLAILGRERVESCADHSEGVCRRAPRSAQFPPIEEDM